MTGSILATATPESLTPRLKALLSNVGVAALIAACLPYHESHTVFPGLPALLPVWGTASVIAGIGAHSIANGVLRLKPMRWVGEISRSLYLVHWPVICLGSLLASLHTHKAKAAVIVSSFILGWLSWRFVETPFRRMSGRASNRRVAAALGMVIIGFTPFLVAIKLTGQAQWNNKPTALGYAATSKADRSFFREGTCFITARYADG